MKNKHIGKKSGSWIKGYLDGNRSVKRFVLDTHNFSDIEDNKNGWWIIRHIAKTAGDNASAEAIAAGLPRVYMRNYKDLVKINANGEEILIQPQIKRASYYVKYKPSTILHAVKK